MLDLIDDSAVPEMLQVLKPRPHPTLGSIQSTSSLTYKQAISQVLRTPRACTNDLTSSREEAPPFRGDAYAPFAFSWANHSFRCQL